jgi:hypothetical protein
MFSKMKSRLALSYVVTVLGPSVDVITEVDAGSVVVE